MYHVPHRHHWSYGMSRYNTPYNIHQIYITPLTNHTACPPFNTLHTNCPHTYTAMRHIHHSPPNTHHNPCTALTHLPPYTVHAHCHISPPSPVAHSICRAPGHTFHPALFLPLPREEAQRHLHDHPHGRKPRRHGEMVGAE